MSAMDALRHRHSSLVPQKMGGKYASLCKLALTGGMRELSQTFDRSANTAEDIRKVKAQHREVWVPPRPQIQLTGPCIALLPRAAAMGQTTKWRCVPHSPGSPAYLVSLPGSRHPKDLQGSQPILHTNPPSLEWAAEGSGAWPPTPGVSRCPPGTDTLHVSFRNDNPRMGVGEETPPRCSLLLSK